MSEDAVTKDDFGAQEAGRPVALVTGATSGIGTAIARQLHGNGYDIVGFDLVAPKPEVVKDPSTGSLFSNFEQVDLTDRQATFAAVERVLNRSVPAVLVHCAGWTPWGKFIDTDPEQDDKVIAVNLLGTLNIIRPVLSAMSRAESGRVVLISSDAARTGVAGEAVYAATKAAQIAVAKSIAVEVARFGVTINVVCPGTTDTPLLRQMYTGEQIEKRVRANPMKRIGQPHDIAGAVAFFADPASNYITGQVLSVNGGLTRAD